MTFILIIGCTHFAIVAQPPLICQYPAEAFRRQITLGLDKDSRAAGKARVILRKLLGTINLRPGPDKSLWAEYELCPSALLKSAGIAGTEGTTGSGGAFAEIWHLYAEPFPLVAG